MTINRMQDLVSNKVESDKDIRVMVGVVSETTVGPVENTVEPVETSDVVATEVTGADDVTVNTETTGAGADSVSTEEVVGEEGIAVEEDGAKEELEGSETEGIDSSEQINVGVEGDINYDDMGMVDGGYDIGGDYGMETGAFPEMGMPEASPKGSVMSSWLFVLGISGITLVISIVLGILLAKKRIKKGFDLYED